METVVRAVMDYAPKLKDKVGWSVDEYGFAEDPPRCRDGYPFIRSTEKAPTARKIRVRRWTSN
jgi:hypothetical protein